jgi:hypothetical protein
LRKKAVAALAGFGEVFGAQGPPDAVFSERRGVHRVVQKPRAVVIPQVVVRIGRGAAQAGDGVERIMLRDFLVEEDRAAGVENKKPI